MFEFPFGFVIPGSTNTWEQIMKVDPNPYPAELLSGNLVVITEFYDGERLISKSKIRIFYITE